MILEHQEFDSSPLSLNSVPLSIRFYKMYSYYYNIITMSKSQFFMNENPKICENLADFDRFTLCGSVVSLNRTYDIIGTTKSKTLLGGYLAWRGDMESVLRSSIELSVI